MSAGIVITVGSVGSAAVTNDAPDESVSTLYGGDGPLSHLASLTLVSVQLEP